MDLLLFNLSRTAALTRLARDDLGEICNEVVHGRELAALFKDVRFIKEVGWLAAVALRNHSHVASGRGKASEYCQGYCRIGQGANGIIVQHTNDTCSK